MPFLYAGDRDDTGRLMRSNPALITTTSLVTAGVDVPTQYSSHPRLPVTSRRFAGLLPGHFVRTSAPGAHDELHCRAYRDTKKL